MAITFTATADFGQSGQYIARITGRAKKVNFARDFIGRKSGKRNDVTTAIVDEPGLYEVVNRTRKGRDIDHWIVLEHEGDLTRIRSDEEDFLAIAKRLDGGEKVEEIVALEVVEVDPEMAAKYPDSAKTKLVYVIRNKREANKAQIEASVDSAVGTILAALTGMPPTRQREVIDRVRKQIFPPKPNPRVRAESAPTNDSAEDLPEGENHT